MKTSIVILLIALLVLTLFAGCTKVPVQTGLDGDGLIIDETSDSDIIENLEVEFIEDDDYVELGDII